jgi:hypothetical protein
MFSSPRDWNGFKTAGLRITAQRLGNGIKIEFLLILFGRFRERFHLFAIGICASPNGQAKSGFCFIGMLGSSGNS